MTIYDPDEPAENYRWWEGKSELERFGMLKNTFERLEEQDRSRQASNLHHLRLYGNLPVEGVNPWNHNRRISDDRITLNVIASAVDVAGARIGKQKPAPKILPQGGNYSLRRKSKLLERFLQAQFDISKVYQQSRMAFLDGCIFGTGCLKVYDTDKTIEVERVFPSEILVDPMESLYGEPRQIMQRKWLPRDVVKRLFYDNAKKKKGSVLNAIVEASDGDDPSFGLGESAMKRETVGDQILVVEAWRLPTAPGAGDGAHAIMTTAGMLLDEEWEMDRHPFLFFHWKTRPRGFWGAGIAEELCSIQIEINRLLQRLQEGHKRLGSPLIFLDARSKLQKNAMTNEVGSFVHYMGNPPVVATFQTAHPEIYQQLDRLWNRAFDLVGISQDTATPNQETLSGISARTQHEIGTERFSLQAQRFEEVHLEVVPLVVACAKRIAKRYPSFAQPSEKDRHTISRIRFSDVDMKEDEYVVRILPQSSLPQLPSHKLEMVNVMFQAGAIDPQTYLELLDFPDLERFLSLTRAQTDNIERQIESILDDGKRETPEPMQDARECLKRAMAAYFKAVADGVPEDRLQMLRDYMTEANRLHQKAQAEQMKLAVAQAAQQGPVAPGPGAPPATGPGGQPPMAATPADGLA